MFEEVNVRFHVFDLHVAVEYDLLALFELALEFIGCFL